MRYTTIIDISEFPTLYRSEAVRLIYLHLVLRAGYHDHDRDLCGLSLRRLVQETGLTISAVRCAIKRLMAAQLIERQGPLWKVKKYLLDQPITPRAKTEAQAKRRKADEITEQINEEHRREIALQEERRKRLRAQGKTSFMVYYEEQQAKAAAGDPQAAEFVKNQADTYKLHADTIRKEQQQQQKKQQ